MSLYNESGYDIPRTNRTMIALRSVSSHNTGVSGREGNTAASTWGIVSPMMMQKATIPPNAKAHCATEIAMSPDLPKQCCIVSWKEFVPLSFEFVTISRIVQSTVTVKATRRNTPVSKPACLNAYGCPMMPAPMMLFAMFMNALFMPLFGRADSRRSSGLKSSVAKVTLGASISVRSGTLCPVSLLCSCTV